MTRLDYLQSQYINTFTIKPGRNYKCILDYRKGIVNEILRTEIEGKKRVLRKVPSQEGMGGFWLLILLGAGGIGLGAAFAEWMMK